MKAKKKLFKNAVDEKCAMTAPQNVPTKMPANMPRKIAHSTA